jgi:hypothetical protein
MSYYVYQPAATQNFVYSTDSKSVLLSSPSYCGPIEYSITQAYTFVTIVTTGDPGVI